MRLDGVHSHIHIEIVIIYMLGPYWDLTGARDAPEIS